MHTNMFTSLQMYTIMYTSAKEFTGAEKWRNKMTDLTRKIVLDNSKAIIDFVISEFNYLDESSINSAAQTALHSIIGKSNDFARNPSKATLTLVLNDVSAIRKNMKSAFEDRIMRAKIYYSEEFVIDAELRFARFNEALDIQIKIYSSKL